MFNDSTPSEIETVMQHAWNAFHIYRRFSLAKRAAFMKAIAVELGNCGDDLIHTAMSETKPEVAVMEEALPPELLTAYELITNLYFLNGDQGQGLRQSLTDLGVKQPSKLLQEFLTRAGECRFSVTEMYQKLEEVDRVRFEMYKFLKNYDVSLAPVAATPAKLHSLSHKEWQDFSYTMPYNLTGWPAAVVRIGTSPEALPIRIQVIAKPWHDYVALAVAKKLEEIFGGWRYPYVN